MTVEEDMRLRIISGILLALVCTQPALGAPDITGDVSVTVTPVQDQGKVEFDINITNQGDADCGSNWWVDFWPVYPCACDVPPWVCNQATDVHWEFGAGELGAGDTFSQQAIKFLPPSAQPYRYMLAVDSWIDSQGFCAVSTDGNNFICGEFVVDDEIDGPDLVISDCKVEPDPDSPSNMIYSARVSNEGGASTIHATSVEFFVDSEEGDCEGFFGILGDTWADVPAGLPAGQFVDVSSHSFGPLPGGEYLALGVVNSSLTATEYDVDNNCCQVEYAASDRPDLVLDEFNVVMAGNVAVYQGVVSNQGYRDIEPGEQFKICVYFDEAEQPAICETPDVEGGGGLVISADEGLPIGQTLEFGKSRPGLGNGVYEAWAQVDCDCEVLEVDEKNNVAKKELVVDIPGPDLQVKVFAGNQVVKNGKSEVRYVVVVTNAGTDPVESSFDIDLFYDMDTPPSEDELGSEGLYAQGPPLAPGEFYQHEFVWSEVEGVPAGTYQSWVVLDIVNLVFEVSEANNVKAAEVKVGEVSDEGVNLAIEEFSAKVYGNNISYRVVVRNTSSEDITKPFNIDLFEDRETQPGFSDLGDQRQEVTLLRAGESKEWEPEGKGIPDGEYLSYVVVDTGNLITESNEADNIAGPRIAKVCSTCDACADGQYLKSECVCGEETVWNGFCCGGEWYAVGCPSLVEETDDVLSSDSSVIEFDPPFQGGNDGCGCRIEGPKSPTLGSGLLLLLALVLFAFLRRAQSTCQPPKTL